MCTSFEDIIMILLLMCTNFEDTYDIIVIMRHTIETHSPMNVMAVRGCPE